MNLIAVLALATALGPQLIVKNYVPSFIAFYNDAVRAQPDEQQRWQLWQKEYGIAAVPPTAEGQTLAREQLNTAWSRYATLIPSLTNDESTAENTAQKLLPKIADLLTSDPNSIRVRLVLFVGQFDGNSFAYRDPKTGDGTAFVAVEIPKLALTLAHEMSHAVHYEVANVRKGYVTPLGETIWLEGIAMRSAQRVVPGFTDEDYTGGDAAWVSSCSSRRDEVLKDVLNSVEAESADVVSKYTYGTGMAGLHREAYCAGWLLVGHLLEMGHSFHELASIQESEMVPYVRRALMDMIDGEKAQPSR